MTIDQVKEKVRKVGGWLSDPEVEILYNTAKRCTGRGVVVEIGSWQGKSTICLAGGSEEKSKTKVYAVDPHENSYVHVDFLGKDISTFDIFKENIKNAGVDSLVHPLVGKSEDMVVGWNQPIEFLWIDGDHRYQEVKKDFDLWFPFLIEGGVVAFHDSTSEDVQKYMFKEILPLKTLKQFQLVDSITVAVKTGRATFFDRVRSRFVMLLSRLQSFGRRLPLPAGFRSLVKQAGKKTLLVLGR